MGGILCLMIDEEKISPPWRRRGRLLGDSAGTCHRFDTANLSIYMPCTKAVTSPRTPRRRPISPSLIPGLTSADEQ
jgi:hypothetical protein